MRKNNFKVGTNSLQGKENFVTKELVTNFVMKRVSQKIRHIKISK